MGGMKAISGRKAFQEIALITPTIISSAVPPRQSIYTGALKIMIAC
jgi:hypothetical protein